MLAVPLCGTGRGAPLDAFSRITSDQAVVFGQPGQMASSFIRPWEREEH